MVAEKQRHNPPVNGPSKHSGDRSKYLMSAQGISKIYRNGGVEIVILKKLDLNLASGESVAVVGAPASAWTV